jgi:hypothetical protein
VTVYLLTEEYASLSCENERRTVEGFADVSCTVATGLGSVAESCS